MNKPTVQDIFQCFYPAYLEKYSPSPEQAKVARNILNCKTGAYGANVSVCEDCGAVQVHYNSCRNRCCPMCQAVPKEIWMDARREDAQSVIDYLGKYTHRIAISNHRIIRMDDETVTFFVKDYRNKGEWKELTISGIEFIRRFLMHVPPKRFVRIRHYGLLCSRSKRKKLTLCRNLLGCKKYLSKLGDKEMPEILKQLYGINVCVCKSCGGHLGKPQLRIPQRC